jgi:hypothetical protein
VQLLRRPASSEPRADGFANAQSPDLLRPDGEQHFTQCLSLTDTTIVHPTSKSYLPKKKGTIHGSAPLFEAIQRKKDRYDQKDNPNSVAARAGAIFTVLVAETYGFMHKDYVNFLRLVAEEADQCGLAGLDGAKRYHNFLRAEAAVCIQRANSLMISNWARNHAAFKKGKRPSFTVVNLLARGNRPDRRFVFPTTHAVA